MKEMKFSGSCCLRLFLALSVCFMLTAETAFAETAEDREGVLPWSIVVFIEKYSADTTAQQESDMSMLVTIDRENNDIRMVTVPGELLMIDTEGASRRLKDIYKLQGPEGTVLCLNQNLGIVLDDYVSVSWKTLADAVNLFGGLDIELSEEEFRYINAFITEVVAQTKIPSTIVRSAGRKHLDGVQTVAYTRIQLMDAGKNRLVRLRQVVSQLSEKALLTDWHTYFRAMPVLLSQIRTSIDRSVLEAMLWSRNDYHTIMTGDFPVIQKSIQVGEELAVTGESWEEEIENLKELLLLQ